MPDDKIDPAITALTTIHPDKGFVVDGHVVTSTCNTMADARPLVGGHAVTDMLHAEVYKYCIESTGLPRKNVIADAAERFGRKERQIERILAEQSELVFPKSE